MVNIKNLLIVLVESVGDIIKSMDKAKIKYVASCKHILNLSHYCCVIQEVCTMVTKPCIF